MNELNKIILINNINNLQNFTLKEFFFIATIIENFNLYLFIHLLITWIFLIFIFLKKKKTQN